MEIRDNNSVCIIKPLSLKIDSKESFRIFNEVLNDSRNLALDLSYVRDCTIDFIEDICRYCNNRAISIFNIPSDIFILFNTMGVDKLAKLFVNELDFEEDLRQMINRRFSVI